MITPPYYVTSFRNFNKPLFLGITALLSGVISASVFYIILPLLGIHIFEELFSISHLLLLLFLLGGIAVYKHYLDFIRSRPDLLLYFTVAAWPFVEFLNQYLLDIGINIHLRPLLVMLIAIPAILLGIKHRLVLWRALPYLKYYLGFFLILTFYFLFYNNHTVIPNISREITLMEGSIDITQFIGYAYCLFGMIIAAVSLLYYRNSRLFFDTFNKLLLIASVIGSLIAIIGYPFNALSMNLEGFNRTYGVFTHPNPFSHHMGIVLIYLIGLLIYYQGENKIRFPLWLLLGGILLNLVAFLLGLSKTAIALFTFCTLLLLLFNLSTVPLRTVILKSGALLLLLLPLGFWIFGLVTDHSFGELLQARLENLTSLSWRTNVWNLIISSIDADSILFGHGFTSSNSWIFQLTYNNINNFQPLIMVHNGYLALLYDLGILGLSLFVAVGSLIINTCKRLLYDKYGFSRPLLVTVLAMAIYFLIGCSFDELTYMFDAALLFWLLTTFLYIFTFKEAKS